MHWLSYALQQLRNAIFPTRCIYCETVGDKAICDACSEQLVKVGENYCIRCGRIRKTSFRAPDCGVCHGEPLGVIRARSLLRYDDGGRRALAAFKYEGSLAAGKQLSSALRKYIAVGFAEVFDEPGLVADAVVAVPLHARRLRQRSYNQAELLAEAVALELRVQLIRRALIRRRDTPTQVGLSAPKRYDNVRGAFAVAKASGSKLQGKTVLLVDDLMTTGATLRACASALKKGGARRVYGLTLFSTLNEFQPR